MANEQEGQETDNESGGFWSGAAKVGFGLVLGGLALDVIRAGFRAARRRREVERIPWGLLDE